MNIDFKYKYLKYKNKYLERKNIINLKNFKLNNTLIENCNRNFYFDNILKCNNMKIKFRFFPQPHLEYKYLLVRITRKYLSFNHNIKNNNIFFIQIIENKKLYDEVIRKTRLLIQKDGRSYINNLQNEVMILNKLYTNEVAWELNVNSDDNTIITKWILIPKPEKIAINTLPQEKLEKYPFGTTNIEDFYFPWYYEAFLFEYNNEKKKEKDRNNIYCIRELDLEDAEILKELQKEIKEKLVERFFNYVDNEEKENYKDYFQIFFNYNSSEFSSLKVNIEYVGTANMIYDYKWRTESRIYIDNVIDLLENNKLNDHIFVYSVGINKIHTLNHPLILQANPVLQKYYPILTTNTLRGSNEIDINVEGSILIEVLDKEFKKGNYDKELKEFKYFDEELNSEESVNEYKTMEQYGNINEFFEVINNKIINKSKLEIYKISDNYYLLKKKNIIIKKKINQI